MSIIRKVASRANVFMKVALQGLPGSGKTKSALLLAYGLVGDWSKITVIDTENGSASLYSDLGAYNTIDLAAPYSPERYIEAINACIEAGDEVIIIDSLSHEWNGDGGILQIVDQTKNKFGEGWKNATPRHQSLVDKILQAPVHIVATMRSKQEYLQEEVNGKTKIKKVGTAAIQRDGLDYEFTVVFDVDNKLATATKDRTQIFEGRNAVIIGVDTGKAIKEWCQGTAATAPISREKIAAAKQVINKKQEEFAAINMQTLADTYGLGTHVDKVAAVVKGMGEKIYTADQLKGSIPTLPTYTDAEKASFIKMIDYVESILTS